MHQTSQLLTKLPRFHEQNTTATIAYIALDGAHIPPLRNAAPGIPDTSRCANSDPRPNPIPGPDPNSDHDLPKLNQLFSGPQFNSPNFMKIHPERFELSHSQTSRQTDKRWLIQHLPLCTRAEVIRFSHIAVSVLSIGLLQRQHERVIMACSWPQTFVCHQSHTRVTARKQPSTKATYGV